MNVAIIGSRNCGNLTIEKIIDSIPQKTSVIISGGATGVDTLAKKAALKLNVPLLEILPNYEKYGRKAPLVRNLEIISKSDEVVAFWDYKSYGTKYVIHECLKIQKPIKIIIVDN